jgi:hypothetical protein
VAVSAVGCGHARTCCGATKERRTPVGSGLLTEHFTPGVGVRVKVLSTAPENWIWIWPTLVDRGWSLRLLLGEEDAFSEEVEFCAAEHLALDHL